MAVSAPSTQPAEPKQVEDNGAVPPLENGDRLTPAPSSSGGTRRCPRSRKPS